MPPSAGARANVLLRVPEPGWPFAEGERIAGSPPAPLLTLITGPSAESDDAGRTRKDFAERHNLRYRWWAQLLELAKTRTKLHAGVGPGTNPYLAAGAGRQGITYNYAVRRHDARVMLWVDRGAEREEETEYIFSTLESQQEAIEGRFGAQLRWDRSEGRRALWVASDSIDKGYQDPEESWPQAQEQLVGLMVSLERAFAAPIQSLQIG